MKILAVSDTRSRSLETLVAGHADRLNDINLIVSCGDLDRPYIEFLVNGINRDLFFVSGNDPFEIVCAERDNEYNGEHRWEQVQTFKRRVVHYTAGASELHGRVEVFRNYLIAGFGGPMWYNGKGNQHTESQMSRIVNSVERRIDSYQLRDKLLGRKQRGIIVISHAPIYAVHDGPDRCHTGFKCFRRFLKDVAPLAWIHGHIRPANLRKGQVSIVDGTTVINAYGYEIITIDRREVAVTSRV